MDNKMKCHTCDLEEGMPFRCTYCRESFCHLHRIPINHFCPFLNTYTEKRRLAREGIYDNSYRSFGKGIGRSLLAAIKSKSSKTELLHLAVAALLVIVVGLSLDGYMHFSWPFLAIFISAFLVHELAHKLLAQYYGSRSEFRAQMYGLVVTEISALPLMPFKFIAPGAVMVGLTDSNKFGRVALVGPLTNLVMGFSFLVSAHFYPFHSYFYAGASFNSWIALFNLLSFGVLDGQKIFDWNKIAWGCTMAVTVSLFVTAHL